MKPKIAFRLDSGKDIGLGHLMRCMSIAKELVQQKIEVVFICRNRHSIPVPYEVYYLSEPYLKKGLSIEDELCELAAVLKEQKVDFLLVDHYGATDEWFRRLREMSDCKIGCMEDGIERKLPVDMLINGNIYGPRGDYGDIPVKLLGGEYTLLRDTFRDITPKELSKEIKDIYITSGGTDALQFCGRIYQDLYEWSPKYRYHIIVGTDFEEEYVKKLEETDAQLEFHADMKQCMEDADIFISSAGSTTYELAVMGVPTISFVLWDNQQFIGTTLWEEEANEKGGFYSEYKKENLLASMERMQPVEYRRVLRDRARKLVSGYGAKNVANEIVRFVQKG
ncbi:MAG: UDP-2,4-diacetamido-2,4,6-trideoxy-beta-L-altropyranose hydrolase [Lachnospiraceae bacterium]|nr:UDP-2,4-diacetamido-2,4,6-trideoxy-beta-L-altropyranose hydrolase [Lachnospiraceae bacterium]